MDILLERSHISNIYHTNINSIYIIELTTLNKLHELNKKISFYETMIVIQLIN